MSLLSIIINPIEYLKWRQEKNQGQPKPAGREIFEIFYAALGQRLAPLAD